MSVKLKSLYYKKRTVISHSLVLIGKSLFIHVRMAILHVCIKWSKYTPWAYDEIVLVHTVVGMVKVITATCLTKNATPNSPHKGHFGLMSFIRTLSYGGRFQSLYNYSKHYNQCYSQCPLYRVCPLVGGSIRFHSRPDYRYLFYTHGQ